MSLSYFFGCPHFFNVVVIFEIVLFFELSFLKCFLHFRGNVNFCGHSYFWNFLHFRGHLPLFGYFHLWGWFDCQSLVLDVVGGGADPFSWQNRFAISSYNWVDFWEYLLMCDCGDVYLSVNILWHSRLTPKRKICTAWKGIKQVQNGNTHYF